MISVACFDVVVGFGHRKDSMSRGAGSLGQA